MDLVQIQHTYGTFLSCSSLGNNIAIVMTFKIQRTCSWESIGKTIYSFIDINRNIIMVCMMISGSAMIGGLGSYSPRESCQPLQHTDTWQFSYVYPNDVTGIVHASLGVIPIGIHWVISCQNLGSICLFSPVDVIFPSASSCMIYHFCSCWRHLWD